MTHTQSVDFRGDLAAAFSLATATLTGCGFRLVNRTGQSLEFTGPGMLNSRESPLRGASRISLNGGAGRIELQAELDGARRMMRVLVGVLMAVAVIQVVFLGPKLHVFELPLRWSKSWLVLAAPFAPWIVIAPLLGRFLRIRTIRALDTLLNNMAVMAQNT